MMIATAPHANLKLNFHDRDYALEELPANAQLLLKDISRLDQQMEQLQFELRHLQAARDLYGTALRTTMTQGEEHGEPHHGDGEYHDNAEQQSDN